MGRAWAAGESTKHNKQQILVKPFHCHLFLLAVVAVVASPADLAQGNPDCHRSLAISTAGTAATPPADDAAELAKKLSNPIAT